MYIIQYRVLTEVVNFVVDLCLNLRVRRKRFIKGRIYVHKRRSKLSLTTTGTLQKKVHILTQLRKLRMRIDYFCFACFRLLQNK